MIDNHYILVEKFIDQYCQEKKYEVKKTPMEKLLRIEVSNLKENIPLSLYNTGTLSVGGSPKLSLKSEFEILKKKIIEEPEILGGIEPPKKKVCSTKYSILLEKSREDIKNTLKSMDGSIHYYDTPTPSEEYRVKISIGNNSISITQYKNGTLFLQGKEDSLFALVCDTVERTAAPSDMEVISRFFANDEDSLKAFTASYSPELLEIAEKQIRENIGSDAFDFMETFDKKWLIASECLRIANIPLPEYSPIVMPASKAYEGYIKKMLIKVGFYPADHFDTKVAKFDFLNDFKSPVRIAFVAKEKYADTFLKKINLSLDTNRNFMMHSDNSSVTKLQTYNEAVSKLNDIYMDIKGIHNYFKSNSVFGL
jgi:hypothetical protein